MIIPAMLQKAFALLLFSLFVGAYHAAPPNLKPAGSRKAIGKRRRHFRRSSAIIAPAIGGTDPIAPTIAERDINSITVPTSHTAAATPASAIAIGTDPCGVLQDSCPIEPRTHVFRCGL
jgi:hypothetical protein